MISADRADRLRVAGLRWHPLSGDRFVIRRAGLDDEVYTISDMMIEPHRFSTGTVLGFNGTTEWALDSVAQEDALWLPGEEQLRELLGGTFRHLTRTSDGYEVVIELPGRTQQAFTASSAADAYADALLALVDAAADRRD
ncbi:MAG TPA: pilus assembly protein CpaE [Cellulomonas sp.]